MSSISYQMNNSYFKEKNMIKENISQDFRSKNIDKTRNYFIEDIKQNDLMSKNHKNVCTALNHREHLLWFCS